MRHESTSTREGKDPCGHTLRDHVRNDDIRDRLKVENIRELQESKIEVVWNTSRGDTKNTSEESLWTWYHLGEESEEDRSRDG